VLALVVEGKTNKEIAAALYLSDKTVKHYLSNACVKLGVSRRSQAAVIFARQEGKGN
jgi:DNA-binding NarL/FixJ family response regulator